MNRRTTPRPIVLIALMIACSDVELPTAPALNRSATILGPANGTPVACLVSLDPSASHAIEIKDRATSVDAANCEVRVNSTSATAFSNTGGSTIDVTGGSIGVTGGPAAKPAGVTGTYTSGVIPLTDHPLTFLTMPGFNHTCDAGHTNVKIKTAGTTVLGPGTYCGGITVENKGATAQLTAGVYFLLGGGLNVKGGATISSTGTGVTFVNTWDATHVYDRIDLQSDAAMSLSANTDAANPLHGVLFYQDPTAKGSKGLLFRSGSGSILNGSIYFPTQDAEFESNSTMTLNGVLVARRVSIRSGAHLVLTPVSGGDSGDSGPPSCTSCLEVVPGALILTAAGQQKQLDAFLVDAQGLRTKVAATFESSDPDNIPVTTTGLATATVVGSTKIVAQFNGQTSREVLVVFATPVADALLITDEQIDGPTTPVDPLADFKPGFRYHAHLKGVTPTVGQVVVNTGSAAVAGRVISVTPGAGFVDVVLELLPANAMFSAFKIHQQFSLKGAPFVLSPDLRTSFDVRASPNGGLRLTQIPGARAVPTNVRHIVNAGPSRANSVEFDLLSFSCEAEVTGGLDFPISLDVVSIDINPALTLTIDADNGFKSAIVTGSITPRIELKPSLTAAVEGKVECKKEISAIYPNVLGVASLIINAWVPYGIGFALEAKTEVAGIGFEALLTGNITTTLGVACPLTCGFVHDITKNFSSSSFKPSGLPTAESIRTELAVKAFAWANLRVGNMFAEALQYDVLEIQAGLNQKFELAGMKAQALDSTYGSGFDLSVFAEAGNGTELSKAAGYLSISLPELKLEVDTAIAESPKGQFKIEPDNVDPGDENALGETAKFTVTLNPATYLGAYAVDEVELRWLKEDDDGNPILEPGRPGCTDIHPISFQSTFECTTDFRMEDIGVQSFYAFVHAKLFGVTFPIPLEIGDNAQAKVKVEKSGLVHRRTDQSNGTFFDMTISTTQPLTPSGSGYSGTGTVTYEQTIRSTNAAGCTFHDHWNGTGTTFTITPHPTLAGRWNLSASVSGTLQHASITDVCGFFSFPLPFSSTPILGTGKEIRRDGVLVGFDFNVASTTSTITTAVTGKLKIN